MAISIRHALIIEDDPATAYLHRLLLEELGNVRKISRSEHGEAGLKLLQQLKRTPPELILLDIQMPRMNGWQFLDVFSRVRFPSSYRPRVMMLSNDFTPAHIRLARSYSDVVGIWEKPLTQEVLKSVVNHLPRNSRTLS